ncbi:adenosylcobinamide-GDP ribazoletransferase [Streptomyces sp. 7-21]|uniref:adenosylcobinamide-GDP ribazoletransferase n=1 Tax=Streptomyces sp. 7-21 TaxID=2802283 RepID=UPI00191C99B2|nr:adenosylcobinamide-GDP ribazoletransferase [Streptomyces sp. 7-21]MBL1066707.1 adenosylcobinamide-GDP ribazoletransferase [Streptomyces sp. 7-21]
MAALPRAGLRFAFGTLTVLPVGGPVAWDRRTAGQGMLCAPVVGLTVGLAAAAAAAVVRELEMGWLLASVAAVAVPAYLSRGLHLDGLADVADGLGSGRPAEEARRVMKRSDTGPFAVVTLVLVLLAQTAALYELCHRGYWAAPAAALLAQLAARTALTSACRSGVPAAAPDGLGAAVAGTVAAPRALAVAAGAVALGAVLGGLTAADAPAGVVGGAAAVVLGLGAAELLLRRCVRRLGGVTGDVLGALAETAATVTLVVLTLTA